MQTDTMKLRELTIRYAVRNDDAGRPMLIGRTVHRPSDSALVLMPLLQNQPSEVFAILCLTTTHRVIAYHEVSRGTLDAALVAPREVFRAALLSNSAAIILAHCHPSGDPTPTADDCQVTRRLVAAGELLGIPVIDHVIIGESRYASFKEAGRI